VIYNYGPCAGVTLTSASAFSVLSCTGTSPMSSWVQIHIAFTLFVGSLHAESEINF